MALTGQSSGRSDVDSTVHAALKELADIILSKVGCLRVMMSHRPHCYVPGWLLAWVHRVDLR